MTPRRPSQSGFTLIESIFVVAVVALVLATAIAASKPMLDRKTLRNATAELQNTIQLNRMEAVSRNRACRFVIHAETGTLQIWDGMGTSDRDDDQLLYRTTLDPRVRFARPDAGEAITLSELDESTFEAILRADGTVASGHGDIVLAGGDSFSRVRLYVAGGTEVQRWSIYGWIL